MSNRIRGPLGLWPFPILNFLLLFTGRVDGKVGTRRGLKRETPSKPILRNLEEITWTDWRGRERNITIHREVQ